MFALPDDPKSRAALAAWLEAERQRDPAEVVADMEIIIEAAQSALAPTKRKTKAR
jgi:hypothetical protein